MPSSHKKSESAMSEHAWVQENLDAYLTGGLSTVMMATLPSRRMLTGLSKIASPSFFLL